MKLQFFTLLSASISVLAGEIHHSPTTTTDFAATCYSATLPSLLPKSENRTTPWGAPEFKMSNGTVCCNSLNQVRAGIDEVDAQLLSLLAQRAAYVREATRFKASLNTVDVPSRDTAVIEGAVVAANFTIPPLPKTIARSVFTAILNSSVAFEYCVFERFCGA